jgi:REP element-mobilizing transposase RayT
MGSATPLVPGQLFHVFSRGNNRESLFRCHTDYSLFQALMWEHVLPVAEIHAYAYLPNHFHLILRIRDAQELPQSFQQHVSQPFSNWFNAFVRRTNRDRGRVGALFHRPFARVPVRDESHRQVLGIYVHINPQRHGIATAFREWPYTSYAELMGRDSTSLQREALLSWYGGRLGFEAALRHWDDAQPQMALLETVHPDLAQLAPLDARPKVRKRGRFL